MRRRAAIRPTPATLPTLSLLLAILPCFIFTRLAFSQIGEFPEYANGLIYPQQTVLQLKHIVDSLNLKFKVCETNPRYQALSQGIAHFVSLPYPDIETAQKDMDQGITFDAFVRKYAFAKVKKNLFVVRYKAKSWEGNPEIRFSEESIHDEEGEIMWFETQLDHYKGPLQGQWVYNYFPGETREQARLEAFYFPQGLSQPRLPEKYARMVQYSDCLVDTTSQLFIGENRKNKSPRQQQSSPVVKDFLAYIHQQTGKPVFSGKHYDAYLKSLHLWYVTRIDRLNQGLAKTPYFQNLLAQAVAGALENGLDEEEIDGAEFEEYVQLYYSPRAALELKRKRQVIGTCSMDTRPRRHALSIALLSAETVNWETFLRAHLDIMNDRFERGTDGSYAWSGRKTYIRELEVLDINVADLLFGISLRMTNPAANHYFGSLDRLGRAMPESAQAAELETRMLSMIADKSLDDYNRLVMYYLFLHYNQHIVDKSRRQANVQRLQETLTSLPPYLTARAPEKK